MFNDVYVAALFGGVLIGLASAAMLLLDGRVAGISGIVGGLLAPRAGDVAWRVAFVGGLLLAGGAAAAWAPALIASDSPRSLPVVLLAGLLVGFGTRLGNGCTSGHGVCGLGRQSRRSLVSVLTFLAVGAATATVLGRLG